MSFARLCGSFRVGDRVRVTDQGTEFDDLDYRIRKFEARAEGADEPVEMFALLVPAPTIGWSDLCWRRVTWLEHTGDAVTRLGRLA